MNQLVIIENEQAVTSSISLAENFEKEHKHVLRDIDSYKKDVPNFGQMFFETTEPDSYGRDRRIYLMNRDGFSLLAMGFTGQKALQFKLEYIRAFNQMEKQLVAPSSTKALLLAALDQEERIGKVEASVGELRDTMRIDGGQEFTLSRMAKGKVIEELGGIDSNAYKTIKRKAFSQFWNEFKRYFKLPRYGDLPRVKMQEAVDFIKEWTPDTALRMEIKQANQQAHLKLVEGQSQ